MSLAQRFERRLEGLVGGAFARVFKGQVEPVEIGSALQREASDKRNVMNSGEVLSPNRYRVTLSPSDHERLLPWEGQLTTSLAELVQEYLDENRWSTIGDIEVYLARDEELHTGVFGVASRMESGAPPRRRPHDSLSMPIVPGAAPGEYPVAPGQQNGPQQGGPQQGGPQHGGPQHGNGQPAYAGQPGMPAAGAYPAGVGAPAYPPGPGQAYPQQQPFAPPGYPQQQPPGTPYPPPGYGQDPNQGYRPFSPEPPQPQAVPTLIVDETNRRFELRQGSNVVGRGTEADLQLLDQGISRRHVDVQYDGRSATIYDLGSTNGTTINGNEVNSKVLSHGDVIRVGHTRIVFHQDRP